MIPVQLGQGRRFPDRLGLKARSDRQDHRVSREPIRLFRGRSVQREMSVLLVLLVLPELRDRKVSREFQDPKVRPVTPDRQDQLVAPEHRVCRGHRVSKENPDRKVNLV